MRYLFEEYALDTERRELRRGADLVATAPQVFDLLSYLIRNRDRVVSKDDLMEAIWNRRATSDAALTTRLNAVRKVIGDSGDEQRLVKTLPRKGFRFVGAVREEGLPSIVVNDGAAPSGAVLALPDKPSIAVMPFQNMSDDPDHDYFADGIVEDITAALARFKSLFVIARNSSFTYKGQTFDIERVRRELGVRYVLQGSVRKASGQVRISGRLLDSATGALVWTDRFDGALGDIFELQDRVTGGVAAKLVAHVQLAEIERANRKSTASLDAYDCYWRGSAHVAKWTREGNESALGYFIKATELDENFATAYAAAAMIYTARRQSRWVRDASQERTEAVRLARRAVELGQMDELALCRGGTVLGMLAGEVDFAAECVRRSLEMNANLAIGWQHSAWLRIGFGEHEAALDDLREAERLSPRDPNIIQVRLAEASANYFLGRYQEAAHLAERITGEFPRFLPAWRMAAISRAMAGDAVAAERALGKALELDPAAKVPPGYKPLRRPEDRERLKDGYVKAGFPM